MWHRIFTADSLSFGVTWTFRHSGTRIPFSCGNPFRNAVLVPIIFLVSLNHVIFHPKSLVYVRVLRSSSPFPGLSKAFAATSPRSSKTSAPRRECKAGICLMSIFRLPCRDIALTAFYSPSYLTTSQRQYVFVKAAEKSVSPDFVLASELFFV